MQNETAGYLQSKDCEQREAHSSRFRPGISSTRAAFQGRGTSSLPSDRWKSFSELRWPVSCRTEETSRTQNINWARAQAGVQVVNGTSWAQVSCIHITFGPRVLPLYEATLPPQCICVIKNNFVVRRCIKNWLIFFKTLNTQMSFSFNCVIPSTKSTHICVCLCGETLKKHIVRVI